MSLNADDTATTLILDLRDRMARIETKLDGHQEAHVAIDTKLKDLEGRVDANTADIAANKTRFATIAAIASAVLAVFSLLGDHLWAFFAR